VEEDGRVYLKYASKKHRGSTIVAHLRGTANVRMATKEILALTRDKE
jgi:hypothetical protein